MRLRVPPEFVWVRAGGRIVLVHSSVRRTLGRLLLTAPHAPPDGAVALPGGRGGTYRITLDGGDVVVLRLYRRGGFIGGLVRETYWGWPPRPFLELATTEEARRRGVPVPQVLGARIDRRGSGAYRGVLVTRHLPGTETLWALLNRRDDEEGRQALSRSAGRTVRALQDAGIYHPDLTLNNCLVRDEGGTFAAFVVDLDRARAMRGALGARLRQRMVRRLERSARKLDPEGKVVGADTLRVLREACRSGG
jgi:3-deoxy-D-manno-octulosonic acid kinase